MIILYKSVIRNLRSREAAEVHHISTFTADFIVQPNNAANRVLFATLGTTRVGSRRNSRKRDEVNVKCGIGSVADTPPNGVRKERRMTLGEGGRAAGKRGVWGGRLSAGGNRLPVDGRTEAMRLELVNTWAPGRVYAQNLFQQCPVHRRPPRPGRKGVLNLLTGICTC